jgi:uncharacterized protein YndB with AHSA1/START domain
MSTATASREIVQTRLFDAPRELVFRMWTEAEHIARWWGPRGFRTTTHSMDVRAGGTWRFIMHGPDGTDFPNRITYREVVRPERLDYLHDSDADNDPHRFEVTVTFTQEGRKTRVTMSSLFPNAAARDRVIEFGAVELGRQTLDRLVEYLPAQEPSDGELVIRRVFKAPRDLVFKAWTEPERLAKWWGPKGLDLQVLRLELRPGGVFHFRMTPPSGPPSWGRFVYRDIAAPERLVWVHSFADEAGNAARAPFMPDFPLELLNTVTLEEHEGRTTLTLRSSPLNATEAERGVFFSMHPSMREGFGGTFEQLADHLAKA